MRAKLIASTWTFSHVGAEFESPARVIEAIYELGLEPEIWLNWAADPKCFDRPTWDKWRQLVRPSPALAFHTRNDRQRMPEEIEFLAYLGGRVLVVHPIVLSLPEYRHERPERHPDVPFIRDLAAAACEQGVFLALENIHNREFQDRTLDAVETFDDRGGLGICIDLGHAELIRDQPGESPVALIRDFAPVLLHLHVDDVLGPCDHQPPVRDHQPLGTGTIDYAEIGAALRAANFTGTAALEILSQSPRADVTNAMESLSRYL
jgi:sugar phosphate isomerase/epimerase